MDCTKVCLQCGVEFTFEIGGPITPGHRKYCTKECKDKAHKVQAKEWYEKNKEITKLKAMQWAKDNPEARTKIRRKSRVKHIEARRARNREYNKRPEVNIKKNKATAEWKKSHLDNGRATENKRRAIKSKVGGSFTPEEWFTLCFAVGFKCLCCGQIKPLEADHVSPVSKGGSSFLHNIQPLCKSCNSSKSAKIMDYRVNLGEEINGGQRAGIYECTDQLFFSLE